MTWEESEHPREENGRFTFKDGGSSGTSPAQILYGKATKEQKEKQSIKEKLLNILGNKATPADILYGDEKSLSKKNKKEGLRNKYEELKFRLQLKANKLSGNIARNQLNDLKGIDTVGMLDIASDKKNLEYSKNAIKIKQH